MNNITNLKHVECKQFYLAAEYVRRRCNYLNKHRELYGAPEVIKNCTAYADLLLRHNIRFYKDTYEASDIIEMFCVDRVKVIQGPDTDTISLNLLSVNVPMSSDEAGGRMLSVGQVIDDVIVHRTNSNVYALVWGPV